jgi:predicted DNA binding CopG/RHH family protein
MAFQPLPVSRDYLELCDRVGHSHRTIDARRRTNGDRRVSVRVTQAQYDDVVERAGNHGLTLAEYVRLVLGLYDVPDMPVD